MKYQISNRRDAFTRVELVVAGALISVLVVLALSAVGCSNRPAQTASVKALINRLATGIELYHLNFRAYPGPISNSDLYAGRKFSATGANNITASENMLLGLIGGLKYNTTAVSVEYDADVLARQQGPLPLNPAIATRAAEKSYVNLTAVELSKGNLTGGDSTIPEVLDSFSDSAMPLLYLRASVRRSGVMSDASTTDGPYQYDLRQILIYTQNAKQAEKQGLRVLGKFETLATAAPPVAPQLGHDALPYFVDQGSPGANNATGTPRAKDGFMLVSAGTDRVFGTSDDICSFGPVVP